MVETPWAVFLSCGTPHTPAQEEFLSAVSEGAGARPADRRPDQIFGPPARRGREERPNSPQRKEVRNESHPTVWNQMEAAMAYAQHVPILILLERGLRRQGMLSDRLEWMAIEETLSPQLLQTERFRQVAASG
jgi:hypothetical protein